MAKIPSPSFGKQWDGNVGAHATAGNTGGPKPGKTAKDVGKWGGNVGKHMTSGKPVIGAPSP